MLARWKGGGLAAAAAGCHEAGGDRRDCSQWRLGRQRTYRAGRRPQESKHPPDPINGVCKREECAEARRGGWQGRRTCHSASECECVRVNEWRIAAAREMPEHRCSGGWWWSAHPRILRATRDAFSAIDKRLRRTARQAGSASRTAPAGATTFIASSCRVAAAASVRGRPVRAHW